MEDIQPRHVIDRLENRWPSRLQQDAKAGQQRERAPQSHHVQTDGAWAIQVVVKCARGAGSRLRHTPCG
jgi:hypothetical protein